MSHRGPVFEWRPRPYFTGRRVPVYYQLSVNRRPVGEVYWTRDDVGPFYACVVLGRLLAQPGTNHPVRYTTRPDALKAVEETYRDVKWGGRVLVGPRFRPA